MPSNIAFIQKLMNRVDRVDRESLQSYVLDMAQENELFRELFQYLTEGVILIGATRQVRLINSLAMNWLGINRVPQTQSQLLEEIADSQVRKILKSIVSEKHEHVVKDFQIITPRELYLRIYLTQFERVRERMTLMILVNRTEEGGKKIDAERLARIEGLISLAAGVAHEIGNPLNSISIHLELLKKEMKSSGKGPQGAVEGSLQVIQAETDRLSRIVTNFLKAARKPPLRFRSENLNVILESALDVMKPELAKHKIRVEFEADKDLPDFLMDRDRLHQAFINMIKNAMESMPRGGKLCVEISHQTKIALIRFKDQGAGIPEEDIPKIFDAYYTTKEEGSGLGLMIVYDALSEHDGRVEVTSKIGKGTTFTLFLPIRQPKLQLPEYDIQDRSEK